MIVGALLHGEAGVRIGGDEEATIRRWAEGVGERTWRTQRAERIILSGLRRLGLCAPSSRQVLEEVEAEEMIDAEGQTRDLTLHRLVDEPDAPGA